MVAALLSWVPKAVGFLAIIRGLTAVLAGQEPGDPLMHKVIMLSWVIAAATMVWGSFVGLLQTNLRRLLAYSSISHAGYMMIGVTAAFANDHHGGGVYRGSESVVFYLVTYAPMTLGTFAGLILLRIQGRPVETIDDLAGLRMDTPIAGSRPFDLSTELERNPSAAGVLGQAPGLGGAPGRRAR